MAQRQPGERTTAAKLGPGSSKYGLEVALANPTIWQPSAPTYVRVGPEAGFQDETTLAGQFFINPHNLTMSTTAGANSFQMIAFTDVAQATGTEVRLAFDLVRTATSWAIVANFRSDATNGLQFAGSGVIAAANPDNPNLRNVRIEFEWVAGNPGRLTMWRTRFVDGAPDAAGRVMLFSTGLPNSQSAVVNHAFVGMVFGQDAGTHGSLYLDEVSFRR